MKPTLYSAQQICQRFNKTYAQVRHAIGSLVALNQIQPAWSDKTTHLWAAEAVEKIGAELDRIEKSRSLMATRRLHVAALSAKA